MAKTLLFSLATHGYDIIWNQCIASHKKYATVHGYDYFCITDIPAGHNHHHVVWTKLPLIHKALDHYEWVIFVDSDCLIQEWCPAFESLAKEWKYLYFAPGFSGRINSGVIICRQHEETKKLLATIIANKDKPLPKEDSVWRVFGGGENGHIIHYCKHNRFVDMIDKKWNNNSDPMMDDYIRHFSGGGAMRKHYRLSWAWRRQSLKLYINTLSTKLWRKLGLYKWYQEENSKSFESLVAYIIARYPLFEGKHESA